MAFSYVVIGTAWRGGHKWSSKFHETAENKCLEFLNQAIRPLSNTAAEMYKAGETCEAKSMFVVKDVVEDVTDGAFTVRPGWEVTAAGKKWLIRRHARSVNPKQDASLDDAINELLKAYEKLNGENWTRFLQSKLPTGIAFEFWQFEETIASWSTLVDALKLESIESGARTDYGMELVQGSSKNTDQGNNSRLSGPRSGVALKEDDVERRDYSDKQIARLLEKAVE